MDSPRRYGATETEHTSEMGETGLLSVQSDLQALSRNVGSIGGSADCVALRGNIRSLRCQVKRKISNEQSRLTNLLCGRSGMSEQQCSDMQQLHSCVARLHQLMEEERSLIQRHPSPSSPAAKEETDWGGSTGLPLLHSVSQLSDTARAERDAADLEELQRDISDLHQIQQELTRMVQDQGKDINVIEANVSVAHIKVKRGQKTLGNVVELKKASRGKKCCIILCVVLAITVPLILAVILAVLLVHFLS